MRRGPTGQLQHRLHLLRQLIRQQQGPAATERHVVRIGAVWQAQRLPLAIQCGEEVTFDPATVLASDVAVGIQPQLAAIRHQQHVPAALLAGGGGFEQQRVALRGEPVQRQQVGCGVQGD